MVNASLKSERSLTGPIFPNLLLEIHHFFLYRKYSSCVIRYVTSFCASLSVHLDTDFLVFDHVRVEIHVIQDVQEANANLSRIFLDTSLLFSHIDGLEVVPSP